MPAPPPSRTRRIAATTTRAMVTLIVASGLFLVATSFLCYLGAEYTRDSGARVGIGLRLGKLGIEAFGPVTAERQAQWLSRRASTFRPGFRGMVLRVPFGTALVDDLPHGSSFLGIQWAQSGPLDVGYRRFFLVIPAWLLILVLAVGAVRLARPWLRPVVRATSPGAISCAHCGYDLRATPDRCPECGEIPTSGTLTQE